MYIYLCVSLFVAAEHELDLLVRSFTLAHDPISVCCNIDLDFVALSPSAALALVRFLLVVLWPYACAYDWNVLSGRSNYGCWSKPMKNMIFIAASAFPIYLTGFLLEDMGLQL